MLSQINPTTIKTLRCGSELSPADLSRTTFEVLKITECPSIDAALDFITSAPLRDHFLQARCAFVIVAECVSDVSVRRLCEQELHALAHTFRDKRLMVLSLEGGRTELEADSKDIRNLGGGRKSFSFEDIEEFCEAEKRRRVSTQIHYKQLHASEFITITNERIVAAINGEASEDSRGFNFASLLLGYGSFEGRLLETRVDTLCCYDGKRLIDHAVESDKILSVRFLQLFDFDLHLANERGDRPLEIAARLPTMDAFIALLKFKFEFWNDELNRCDYNLLHLRNARGFTLLMLAAASGNTGVVNLLAKFGVDRSCEAHGETATSLAWKNGHFDALLTLLKFDARFPRNFKCELEERWEAVPKELKKFVTSVEAFHLAVGRRETAELELVLQSLPNVFHFYNTRNESAALVALKNGNAWRYEELIRLGIFVGFDEKFEDFVTAAAEEEGLMGRALITLMSKSHLGYCTSYEEKKKRIQMVLKVFNALWAIEQIRPILRIVVARPIKIIFDFNRQSVQHLHPEAHNYSSASTFSTKGYIYVGAKGLSTANPADECDVLATLSHKLLHYALQIVYENESRPYFADDLDRAAEFTTVAEACRQQQQHEEIVARVADFDVSEQHAELVARVAHMLALYSGNEERRKSCVERFRPLFTFYERRVVADLRPHALIETRLRGEIFKLNASLGLVSELRASPVRLKPEALKVNASVREKSLIFLSNCPFLTAVALFQRHRVESWHAGSTVSLQQSEQQRLFLYAGHERVEETTTLTRLRELLKLFDALDTRLTLTLIVNCASRSVKLLKTIAKRFQPYRLVFIVDANANTVNREALGRIFDLRDVRHTWNDLVASAQTMLSELPVNFQCYEMSLREFLGGSDSQCWSLVPLNALLQQRSLTVGEAVPAPSECYVRRMFIDSRARNNRWDAERSEFIDDYDKPVRSFDELAGTEAAKVLVLADEPKAGKSATFSSIASRLKRKFPAKWLAFIDQRHHGDIYRARKSGTWSDTQKLATFLGREVLALRDPFECAVFGEFFTAGRVVVLLEMNVFHEEILDFAVRIDALSGSQLWISSWPQHANKLEAAFATDAFKLVPFNEDNRREFFERFLRSRLRLAGGDEELEWRVREIEAYLMARRKEDNFPTDIPLMLRMIADAYEASVNSPAHNFSSNNLFSLYNFFVNRTLGSVASSARLNAVLQSHQKYALKEVFCRKTKNECEEIVKALQILAPRVGNAHKKIFTYGIMYKLERAKLKFIHKTFADFFVAQYIIDNVLNANVSDSGNTEAEMRSLLFLNIVQDLNRCHKTIHRFLDNYIEMNEAELEERFDESCYTFLSNFRPASYFRSLLWRLARHRCFFLIKFLTEIYGDDEKVLREMWGVISVDGYSFLFKTIDKEDGEIDFTFTERVWSLAKEVFHDRRDLIAILKTTLVRSSCSVFKNVFPNFWRFADEFLTCTEKRDILTKDALQLFARNKTKKFFVEVCEISEASLSSDEMKLFLTCCDADGKNLLYHFSKSTDDEALLEYLQKLKKYLTIDEQKAMLTKRLRAMLGEDRKTPAKSFHALWTFAEQQLERSELKSLLLTANASGFTILHESVIEGDEKGFSLMIEVYERILERDEIRELLTHRFPGNKTLLFKATGVSLESILMLWDYLQDLFDDDEITLKKFLAHRDDFGDTAFSSANWYDALPNDLFMPFVRENFAKGELERLFEKDSVTELRSSEPRESKEPSTIMSLNCFCCRENI